MALIASGASDDPAVEIVPPFEAKTILVVEDDDNLREIVTLNLSDWGLRVLHARRGPEALALLQSNREVALLFCDFKLDTAMSGADLARKAREIRPSLKVLLTSGYTSEYLLRHGDPTLPILHKPYRMAQLAALIREILGNADVSQQGRENDLGI